MSSLGHSVDRFTIPGKAGRDPKRNASRRILCSATSNHEIVLPARLIHVLSAPPASFIGVSRIVPCPELDKQGPVAPRIGAGIRLGASIRYRWVVSVARGVLVMNR